MDILEEINNDLGIGKINIFLNFFYFIEEEDYKEKINYDKNQDYDDDEYEEKYQINKKNKNLYNINNNYDMNINNNQIDLNTNKFYNQNKDINNLNKNKNLKEEKEKKKKYKKKISNLEEILKMPDEKFYDYLNLKNSVKNWNDFSQAKFNKNSFNDIKMLDVDLKCRESYIKGFEFFDNDNFSHSYLERFEDNFRKFLEDCDRLELLNLNCDFNSFWGGLSNRLIETYDDETPKITKIIFGSDIHSSFMKKNNKEDNNNNKVKDFNIDINSILNVETINDNKNDDDFIEEDVEKLINYLWYFTDLQSNRRNIYFHPVLRGMNPKIVKELFGYNYEKFDSGDSTYNFFFSSICGANLQNLLIPLRSKFCGNSNYLNSISNGISSLNFFETIMNVSLENEVKFCFPKLFGEKQFSNNGVIFNLNRNTNTVFWPVFYGNLEKNKNRNFTIIHGFKENYRFIDEKIENFLRKTSDFNYTCLDGFNLPFCYPRKFYFKKVYNFYNNPQQDILTNKFINKNEMLNETQKKLLDKNKNLNIPDNDFKEIFLNKLNISSTYGNFNNDFTKKFIHVIPKLTKKSDQKIKRYLNTFDMAKFIEYKEKLEEYHEFLDNYKSHDFYGGLGIGSSDEETENFNRLNDENDDRDY